MSVFLVFSHVMRLPFWYTKEWQNFAQVLHNNRIKFPKDFCSLFHYCSLHQCDNNYYSIFFAKVRKWLMLPHCSHTRNTNLRQEQLAQWWKKNWIQYWHFFPTMYRTWEYRLINMCCCTHFILTQMWFYVSLVGFYWIEFLEWGKWNLMKKHIE